MKKIINNFCIVAIQFLVMSYSFATIPYNEQLVGPVGPGGDSRYKNQVGLDGVEYIRLMNGAVNHVYKDIVVPGDGGLDIDIYRYYSSPTKAADAERYLGGKSVLGIGWDMHMGRIINAGYTQDLDGCSSLWKDANRNPVLELPDGTRKILFNVDASHETSIHHTFVTEDMWVADCKPNGGFGMVVRSPDGMKYYFDEYSYIKSFERPVLSVTKVVDKNNNFYDITYKDISLWETGDYVTPSITIRAISNIVHSDGRVISFYYQNSGLQKIVTPTQTWFYEHVAENKGGYGSDYYLKSVTGPEDIKWQYEYITSADYDYWDTEPYYAWFRTPGLFGLKKVTTPYGATVEYQYSIINRSYIEHSSRLSNKTLTVSGRQPVVWSYKYSAGAYVYDNELQTWSWGLNDLDIDQYISDLSDEEKLKYQYTRVEGPDRINIHQFCEIFTLTPGDWVSECFSQVGQEFWTRTFSKGYEALDAEAKAATSPFDFMVNITKYDRTLQSFTSDRYHETWPVLFSREAHRSIKRGNNYYNKLSTNFDTYFNPELITEYTGIPLTPVQINSPQNVSQITGDLSREWRQTAFTYYNILINENTNLIGTAAYRWIVGLLNSEKIVDYGYLVDPLDPLSTSVPRSENTFNIFDDNGNILSSKKHDVESVFTYHPNGDLWTVKDPLNKVTTYLNYKYGVAQTEEKPESITIHRVVDNGGNITSITDGRNLTRSFEYDGLNRLKRINTPRTDDNDIIMDYSWTGSHIRKTRGGYVEVVKLDSLGNVLEENKGGIITNYQYDVLGRLAFQSYAGDINGTSYQYDFLDRIKRITNTADNTYSKYNYLPENQIEVVDEDNNLTTYTYRAFSDPDQKDLMRTEQKNRDYSGAIPVTTETIVTQFKRSFRGDIMDVNQGKVDGDYTGAPASLLESKLHRTTYDANYYVTQEYFPENGVTRLTKNLVGKTIERQAQVISSSPSATTFYIYDDLHRLVSINYPLDAPDVNYVYDGNDNITQISRGATILDYTYDENDNLITETLTVNGISFEIVYGYNSNDALQKIYYPAGLVVDYAPNVLGQPTQASGFVSNVTYHPNGQVKTLVYNNGETLNINQDNRLFTKSIAAGYVTNLSYAYDNTGNVKSINDGIDSTYNLTLDYDAYNRLTTANGKWGAGIVEYNAHGDIVRKTIGSTDLSYNYNQTTKLLSSITGGNKYSSFFYDIYGNITYNGDVGFTYNDASNLVSIGAKGLNYQYDGSNYRVSINDNGYLTYMQYNKSGSMVYEYDPQKQIGKSYIKVANMLVAREDNLETCDQIDTDGDGALDCQEYRLGTELNNPDTDEDGLNDGDEILSGLNPLLKDTDGDGMPDLYEINNSLNGLVNDADQDFDGDGITNFSEYSQGLSPSNPFVNKAYGTYKYESQQATGLSISRIVLDASNNVYFIRNNNEVVKLDANGLEVWSSTVIYNSVQLDISDELTINDDTIYLSAGSHIYRMPASTGVAEHIFDVATLSPGTKIKYKPSIRRDGLLFVIADDGITTGGSADTKHYLYVIDPITKSLVFDDDITNRKNPFMILQRPVFTENNTFILSDDTIYVHILPESLKSVGVVKLSKSTFGFNPVLMGNNKVLFQVHYPTVQVIIDVSGSRPVVSEGSDDITPLSEVIYGNNLHLVIGPDSGNTAYYRAKESVGSVTQFHLFTAPLVNDYGIHWLYGITKAYTYVNDYVNNYRLPIMPIVTRNNDLIISDGDKLISLNQELNPTYNYVMTRHVKWEKQLPDNIDQLALGHDGTIFVASKSGYIAAISDINSGLDASKMMMLGHDSQLSYTSGKGYTGAKLSITSPVTKTEVLPDTSINLLATATDVTGADISNQIVWVSSIDGVLGTGAIINATLSRGIHGISARLVDTNANPYIIDSIEVTVPTDSYPNIALFTPYQDAQYSSTASAMFNASASDIEDGDISTNIQWQSDVDGVLGVGSSLSVLLTPGSHTITISVTDSGYNTTQLTRPVTVLP